MPTKNCDSCVRDPAKASICEACMYNTTKRKDYWVLKPSIKSSLKKHDWECIKVGLDYTRYIYAVNVGIPI